MPRTPTHTFSMHGGAGAILSVGLLRQIPLCWFEDCVTTTYTTGGDAMISICLWEVRHRDLSYLARLTAGLTGTKCGIVTVEGVCGNTEGQTCCLRHLPALSYAARDPDRLAERLDRGA